MASLTVPINFNVPEIPVMLNVHPAFFEVKENVDGMFITNLMCLNAEGLPHGL